MDPRADFRILVKNDVQNFDFQVNIWAFFAVIRVNLGGLVACTSLLTMNEKFQYRTRPPSTVLKNFEFIVSERVQVNPDNSRAMSALTFLLFKLNTLQAKIVKF